MGPVLSSNETSAIGRLKSALAERLGRRLVEIRLFGSKARGDSRPESDIDMLVIVATDDWHICDTVYDIVTDIQLDLGVIISPKVISRRHFDKCRDLDTPLHQECPHGRGSGVTGASPDAVRNEIIRSEKALQAARHCSKTG